MTRTLIQVRVHLAVNDRPACAARVGLTVSDHEAEAVTCEACALILVERVIDRAKVAH